MSELSQEVEKDCQIRQYIRRPDKQFWLDLLNPPPLPTQADHTRRTRITRYALGAAFALTTFYFLISLPIYQILLFLIDFLNFFKIFCKRLHIFIVLFNFLLNLKVQ